MEMFPIKFDTRGASLPLLCVAGVLGLALNVIWWFVAAATIAYGVKYGLSLHFLPH